MVWEHASVESGSVHGGQETVSVDCPGMLVSVPVEGHGEDGISLLNPFPFVGKTRCWLQFMEALMFVGHTR